MKKVIYFLQGPLIEVATVQRNSCQITCNEKPVFRGSQTQWQSWWVSTSTGFQAVTLLKCSRMVFPLQHFSNILGFWTRQIRNLSNSGRLQTLSYSVPRSKHAEAAGPEVLTWHFQSQVFMKPARCVLFPGGYWQLFAGVRRILCMCCADNLSDYLLNHEVYCDLTVFFFSLQQFNFTRNMVWNTGARLARGVFFCFFFPLCISVISKWEVKSQELW